MKFFIILAVAVVACNARKVQKRGTNGDQQPKIWDALKVLRGGKDLTIPDILGILENALPGKDYPILTAIPEQQIDCKQYAQAGFYADDSSPSNCQVFHRCDDAIPVTSYLCPNKTLFNQITLICDWFYNVDCSKSKQFQSYSNSRLYQEGLFLLDDQMDIAEATGAESFKVVGAPKKKKHSS